MEKSIDSLATVVPAATAQSQWFKLLPGIFLVGAYQEILGVICTIFSAIHMRYTSVIDSNGFDLNTLKPAIPSTEVLRHVHFNASGLHERMAKSKAADVSIGQMTPAQKSEMLDNYRESLGGYTYFE